ncbi:MAG: hypothetical protein U9Q33_01645 [Campylobacterota bacterium]|nr:hypothetical protein [Campylobacterota bacterium]
MKKSILAILLLSSLAFAETVKDKHGVIYKTIKSPYTGKIWLDRNIGAKRVCQSHDDEQCFGDYYQWGRDSDGHEKENAKVVNVTTRSLENPGNLIYDPEIIDNAHDDWAYEVDPEGNKRQARWSKTDGSSVCPKGFRVPFLNELADETVNLDIKYKVRNNLEGFQNFLKIPSTGGKSGKRKDGTVRINGKGKLVYLHSLDKRMGWTRRTKTGNKLEVGGLQMYDYNAEAVFYGKGDNLRQIRCIKH